MENFKDFINESGYIDVGFVNNFTGLFGQENLPIPNFEIPLKRIKGKIRNIDYRNDPIRVEIDLGEGKTYEWILTFDHWKNMKYWNKCPKVGKTAEIEIDPEGVIKAIDYY